MQAREILNEKLKREYQVSVPASAIEAKALALVEEKGKMYKAPGFRPGKVPFSHLKQVFYAGALQDALHNVLHETSEEILRKNNLKPALRPHFHLEPFKEGKDFEYRMIFEVLPEVPEITWSDLQVTQYKVHISDAQVEADLKKFAESQKHAQPLKSPRPSQKGDTLLVEVEICLQGEKKSPSAQPIKFELGSNYFNPDIEEGLVGLSEGDVFEKHMTVSPEVKEKKIVGKPFLLKIRLKEIQETVPFELNEEFALALGFENLDACREDCRQNIQKKADNLAFLAIKRQILDYLAGKYSFDVPEQMIALEFQSIWEQTLSELELAPAANEDESADARDKKFQEYAEKGEEALKEDYQKIALRRVRLGITLSTIGKQEQIQISQEEIVQAIYEKAKMYPGKEKEVIRHYQENRESVLGLQAPLFENKVIHHMLSQASVTEQAISFKELEEYFEKNMSSEDFE